MKSFHAVDRGPARGHWEECRGHCPKSRRHLSEDEFEAVRLARQDRAGGRYITAASITTADVTTAQLNTLQYAQLVQEAELIRRATPEPATERLMLRSRFRDLVRGVRTRSTVD